MVIEAKRRTRSRPPKTILAGQIEVFIRLKVLTRIPKIENDDLNSMPNLFIAPATELSAIVRLRVVEADRDPAISQP